MSLNSPWGSRGIQGVPGVLISYGLQPIRDRGRPGAPRGAPGSRRKKKVYPFSRLGFPWAFECTRVVLFGYSLPPVMCRGGPGGRPGEVMKWSSEGKVVVRGVVRCVFVQTW